MGLMGVSAPVSGFNAKASASEPSRRSAAAQPNRRAHSMRMPACTSGVAAAGRRSGRSASKRRPDSATRTSPAHSQRSKIRPATAADRVAARQQEARRGARVSRD